MPRHNLLRCFKPDFKGDQQGQRRHAPLGDRGKILTPTVKTGSLELMSPDGKVVVAEGYGTAPIKRGKLLMAAKLTTPSGATGTWKVLACEALDVAPMFAAPANCASLFSPATFTLAN